MSYNYRNGSTPDHVDSSMSNSTAIQQHFGNSQTDFNATPNDIPAPDTGMSGSGGSYLGGMASAEGKEQIVKGIKAAFGS